jgi:hypothetical protein
MGGVLKIFTTARNRRKKWNGVSPHVTAGRASHGTALQDSAHPLYSHWRVGRCRRSGQAPSDWSLLIETRPKSGGTTILHADCCEPKLRQYRYRMSALMSVRSQTPRSCLSDTVRGGTKNAPSHLAHCRAVGCGVLTRPETSLLAYFQPKVYGTLRLIIWLCPPG